MKKLLIILILLTSCNSYKEVTNTKKNVKKEVVDNSVIVKESKAIHIDAMEYEIITADPKEELVIINSKGETTRVKNVKSIRIKNKKQSIKTDTEEQKKDIRTVVVDKSKIETEKEVKTWWDTLKDILKWITILLCVSSVVYFRFIKK
ncbi:hypothetical protein N9928_01185 [bacterium]|nr:hypothetical protein [bacterium]